MGFNNEKTVLITGCSSGIGRCLAHGLRARGWRVFATARKPADVTTLAAEGFESLPLDVTSPDSIAAGTAQYEAMIGRLEGQRGPLPFTLPPEAVLKRVVHALESKRPHRRYQVTVPAYLTAWLQRLLPTPLLDWLLYRIGGEGRR